MRRATAKYHDIDKAIADGYLSPAGRHWEESPEGVHGGSTAPTRCIQDPAIDPEKPELLLYLPTGGGNVRLIGVEYVQTLLLRNTETGAVVPWFSPAPWPAHYQVVNAAPSVGQTFDGPLPGPNPGMPWRYELHIWVWAPVDQLSLSAVGALLERVPDCRAINRTRRSRHALLLEGLHSASAPHGRVRSPAR